MMVFGSTLLMAQPTFGGKWTGKEVKNGQPMGFSLLLEKGDTFQKAYDLNPNVLSVKGTWSFNKGRLSFKNSDGILQLQQSRKKPTSKRELVIEFRQDGQSRYFTRSSGPLSVCGWDEGVAEVVVNHEEMY